MKRVSQSPLNPPLNIGGHFILPGENKTIVLPVARLYTHNQLTISIQVIRGNKPGPTLFISSGIHGDELNGVEILSRLFKKVNPSRMRGSLILVPVVNVFGFINRSRYLPDRRDLNRSFPGQFGGSMASRLAILFMKEIVEKSTHGIDLHTGGLHRTNLPQIRAALSHPETLALAGVFGAPVVLNSELKDGSLRHAVSEKNIPMLLFEGGEALRFDEWSIQTGVKGCLNVMRHLKITPQLKNYKPSPKPFISNATSWVRAPQSGVLRRGVKLGALVAQGEVIGEISDPLGQEPSPILAKKGGIVIGLSQIPVVHKGEALFHIAHFKQNEKVGASLEAIQADLLEKKP